MWLTTACRPILLKSTVFMHHIHLAAYGLLDAGCIRSTKSAFPEVPQNSLRIPWIFHVQRNPGFPRLWPPCSLASGNPWAIVQHCWIAHWLVPDGWTDFNSWVMVLCAGYFGDVLRGQLLDLVPKKLKLTQQKQTHIMDTEIYHNTKNKARFGRFLQPPAWKWSMPYSIARGPTRGKMDGHTTNWP